MTRLELLKLVIAQARSRGFGFRRWFPIATERPWVDAEEAVKWLASGRRYYTLIFSHEFAQNFWKAGEEITFSVPSQSFQRIKPDGSVATVQRKPYVRRTTRPDVWKYHLREMAESEEPLRYLRRYVLVEEDLDPSEGD